MQSIKLVDGDIQIENGDLIMIDGAEELATCCRIALGTNKNEWFLNPDAGIDFSLLTGKSIDVELAESEIRNGLFQEARIKTVDDVQIQMDRAKRTATINFSATGIENETISEEVNIGGID